MKWKVLLLAFCLSCFDIPAFAEQPLLQLGKKTVFQRVVSHPGATLYADASAQRKIKNPRTFTSFYVYERQGGMVKVGVASNKSDGWIRESSTTYWPQAITMVFSDKIERDPVLFFKSLAQLEALCEEDSVNRAIKKYIRLFNDPNATIPKNCPVIATEPMDKNGQVAKNKFYLMPVLNFSDMYQEFGAKFLEVACIDADSKGSKLPEEMKTGIVFLIDTTISMGPYIEQTKNFIKTIFDNLLKSKVKENISIGVVAFRSNVEKRPKIKYTSKVISDLTTVSSRDKLENLLDDLQECQFSTHDFNEDSLAGVQEAIDSISWDTVSGKHILLVTDSGPLAATDPTSKTKMSPVGMADQLRKNGIFLTVAHIKTIAGKKNHEYAEKSYRELSKMTNNRSSYIPITVVSLREAENEFFSAGKKLGDSFRKIAENPKQPTESSSKDDSPSEQMRKLTEKIGYAMYLQFIGDKKNTSAPQVRKAWIADADLAFIEKNSQSDPVKSVYPAVLLTKSQLSLLRKQIKLLLDTAQEAFYQGTENFNFYEQLISLAAKAAEDPNSIKKDPNANLAQQGVLLEVLDGLPYRSDILRRTHEDWIRMSTGELDTMTKRLKGLIAEYDKYDQDSTHWESFGSPNANDWVYRVPLDMLP